MLCHECATGGEERPAVALCRFCFVALCQEHLADAYRQSPGIPFYARHHAPAGAAERAATARPEA